MHIAIYIYDDAEVLDFAGPFEVFTTAARISGLPITVSLVAKTAKQIRARAGFTVVANATVSDVSEADVLIIPGGDHTEAMKDCSLLTWIKAIDKTTTYTASVCTGAFILAATGLLSGHCATTHWEDLPDLIKSYADLTVLPDERVVKSGKFYTSGGISAGIDMALNILSTTFDKDLAKRTARQMEFRWH